jgi:hypothetical protein
MLASLVAWAAMRRSEYVPIALLLILAHLYLIAGRLLGVVMVWYQRVC